MMAYSPVVVFAYNRPEHLRRTLSALAANELAAQSELIIYCDGPKPQSDLPAIEDVREIARTASGFATITVYEREANLGLAGNILAGVNETFEKYPRIIVLEDDLITSPFFLRFMNDALDCYADVPEVGNIHGWCFPSRKTLPDTFFLPGGGCWGWATWRNSWECLEWDPQGLHEELNRRKLLNRFNRGGNYDFSTLLLDMGNWAARRYASMMCLGQLTLTPGRSLIEHEGDDGSGTNCGIYDTSTIMTERPITVVKQPLQVDPHIEKLWDKYFGTVTGNCLLRNRIKSFLPGPVRQFLRAIKKRITR